VQVYLPFGRYGFAGDDVVKNAESGQGGQRIGIHCCSSRTLIGSDSTCGIIRHIQGVLETHTHDRRH
jgi:hypothetical protein